MKQFTSLMMLLIASAVFCQELATDGKIMLTVFLRHDQTKTLDAINQQNTKRR